MTKNNICIQRRYFRLCLTGCTTLSSHYNAKEDPNLLQVQSQSWHMCNLHISQNQSDLNYAYIFCR